MKQLYIQSAWCRDHNEVTLDYRYYLGGKFETVHPNPNNMKRSEPYEHDMCAGCYFGDLETEYNKL